jgi:hypothetical protein
LALGICGLTGLEATLQHLDLMLQLHLGATGARLPLPVPQTPTGSEGKRRKRHCRQAEDEARTVASGGHGCGLACNPV